MSNSAKSKLLGATELVEKSSENIPPTSIWGPKKNSVDGSDQEVAKLAELHSNLREILSLERIGTENTRMVADYCGTTREIRLRKVSGTLQTFGQTNESNETFLKPHEALYLIEMNRLIVFENTVVISLEEAYDIFLNQDDSLTLEEYFVFSFLNKLGYIVRRFNPNTAYNLMGECPESSSGTKRKNISPECGSSSKKLREDKSRIEHLIEAATVEQCPEDLKSSFASFSVITLAPERSNTLEDVPSSSTTRRKLAYSFDLYNPRKVFRKSQPPPPNYRIVLNRFDQMCPSQDELVNLHHSYAVKCPIIVIYIDDHLKMSGFLYNFA